MKYLVTVLCIALLVSFCLPVLASATTLESEIEAIAEQHENVQKARCVVYNNCCLLAVKPQKLTTKSNFEQMKQELHDEIAQKQDFAVIVVTLNPKIMQKIDSTDQMDEQQKEQFIQQLVERALEHLSNHPFPRKFAK